MSMQQMLAGVGEMGRNVRVSTSTGVSHPNFTYYYTLHSDYYVSGMFYVWQ